jgi:hypothetical protein
VTNEKKIQEKLQCTNATPSEQKEKTRGMGESDKGRGVENNLLTRDITCPEW